MQMTIRFDEWLNDQLHRDDYVGDLARVASKREAVPAPSRRAPDEHRIWADIVTRIVEPGYIDDFNDAWQEFLLAKQTAQESED